jgi:perosamine synthetase
MPFRHLPPAHSPVRTAALAAGARAALGEERTSRVRDLVERDWGARDVLLTSSGTAALTLALRAAAALRPGRPVALPAYACYDLATAVDGADLPVLLYDVDPDTLAPGTHSLNRALDAGPCAVVVAHLYGVPVDMDAVVWRAAAADALLIEDAAQGSGAALRRRPAGSLAPVSVLSFGRGKGRTGGAGGALLAHDAAGEALVRHARLRVGGGGAGWGDLAGAAAVWMLARPSVYAVPAALPFLRLGETVYHPPTPPRRLSRAAAGVLAAGWERASREPEIRRGNAARLLAAVHAAGARVPRVPPGAAAGWLRLPVLLDADDAPRARTPAARRLGIAPGYPRALCDLDGFRARILNPRDAFDGARHLAATLATLPTHSLLREPDLRALEGWIAATASVRVVTVPASVLAE